MSQTQLGQVGHTRRFHHASISSREAGKFCFPPYQRWSIGSRQESYTLGPGGGSSLPSKCPSMSRPAMVNINRVLNVTQLELSGASLGIAQKGSLLVMLSCPGPITYWAKKVY